MWAKTIERNRQPLATPEATSTPVQERSPVPPAPVAQTPKGTAVFGKTMRVRGEIYCDEELYLDGEIDGTLEVRHRLTIGPNGKVKANVKAQELVVSGSIQGDVEAAERISIMKGASIVGDVKTAGIVIEDGAYFKGGIDILRPENKKPENKKPETASNTHSAAVNAHSAAR
ncbi:MAG TPA: polymer-forming cytoskeletal protein [Bryobacteraceae bacterium]|jgi:cytoskeletal protein CcmA (bactofilin family)